MRTTAIRPMKMMGSQMTAQSWNCWKLKAIGALISSPLRRKAREALLLWRYTLNTEDLRERRTPDLELLLGGLARADEPLDLVTGLAQHARKACALMALGPGEH